MAALRGRLRLAQRYCRRGPGGDRESLERNGPNPSAPGVSEGYELDHPESLFGYLGQVRLAYMMGADLAALAMCRAVTENLFRNHYNNNDKSPDLPGLIRITQEKPRCGFMRHLHIVDSINIADRVDIADGVKEANRILHSEGENIPRKRVPRELVKGWTRVLAELIRHAPPAAVR